MHDDEIESNAAMACFLAAFSSTMFLLYAVIKLLRSVF